MTQRVRIVNAWIPSETRRVSISDGASPRQTSDTVVNFSEGATQSAVRLRILFKYRIFSIGIALSDRFAFV